MKNFKSYRMVCLIVKFDQNCASHVKFTATLLGRSKFRKSFTQKKKQIHSLLIFLWKIKGIGNPPTLARLVATENFQQIKIKLLARAQHLGCLSLNGKPKIRQNSFIPLPWRFSKHFLLNGHNNVNCKMKTRPKVDATSKCEALNVAILEVIHSFSSK
jgi:hypothetical protein